ncbi:MGMT family protein [Chamaesiphon sp. VAR_48_metabat_135_sub]|uniref:MGMT family protein n=1 Tax=Chamaesiphon sp. VAR_48_metabat_135_sub TaxID=2964699 RepID=UPI00286AAF09|nr:MGMT family protein [Chamaesiphon sp. VAR_48_metabat_135_sub]
MMVDRVITPKISDRSSKYQTIYEVVRKIPLGKVITYGQVAELAGLYGKARLVGYALFRVEIESDIPWQRVVNSKGEISYSIARCGGDYLQKTLLEQEGIKFKQDNRIDLKIYRWLPPLDLMDD